MNVLVINSGSSSLKFKIIEPKKKNVLFYGHIDGIGRENCLIKTNGKAEKKKVRDHTDAVRIALGLVDDIRIDAVGHRVVHGAEKYDKAVRIDAQTIRAIEKLCELAPLHNPPNLAGIKACKKALGTVAHYAVFDTAFHQSMPKENYLYAIPDEFYTRYGIRKYGFHGTSHKYVAQESAKLLGKRKISMISCHLGNGSSICCIEKGKSKDTSMGFTPLQGLIMGTRSGDIDPEVVAMLCHKLKKDPDDVIEILNKRSGLMAIAGTPDVREIFERSKKKDKRAELALKMLAARISFYILGYASQIKTIDAIAFTAGIGQGAYYLRKSVCERLSPIGVTIDVQKNKKAVDDTITLISSKDSKVKILVIPADEELMIAQEVADAML